MNQIRFEHSKAIVLTAFTFMLASIIFVLGWSINDEKKVDAKEKEHDYSVIVCGDSRIVGMVSNDGVKVSNEKADGTNKDKNIYYLAETGEGYYWLKDNLIKLKRLSDKHTVIYIVLGVNDLGNKSKYIDLYNELLDELNCKKVMIAKVGAVNESKEKRYGYTVKQSNIDSFNKKLSSNAKNYTVIDFWAGDESKQTTDGIHYNNKEYKKTIEKLKAKL